MVKQCPIRASQNSPVTARTNFTKLQFNPYFRAKYMYTNLSNQMRPYYAETSIGRTGRALLFASYHINSFVPLKRPCYFAQLFFGAELKT